MVESAYFINLRFSKFKIKTANSSNFQEIYIFISRIFIRMILFMASYLQKNLLFEAVGCESGS